MTRRLVLIFAIFILAVPFSADAVSTSQNVAITICPGSSCGASVTVSNYAPNAGDTITVYYNPGSHTPNANDQLQLNFTAPRYACGAPLYESTDIPNGFKTAPNGPGSITLKIPNVASDVPQKYVIDYIL